MPFRLLKKVVSIFTLIAFLSTNIIYAAPDSKSLFKNKKIDYDKISAKSQDSLQKRQSIRKSEDIKETQSQKKETKKILSSHLEDASQIHIPQKLGRITEVYHAPITNESRTTNDERRLIVHIQDLHTNPEAELNLAKILEILLKDYNMGLVCSEGAVGKVDTSNVSSFPDYSIKEKVSRIFINSGELTGEEYLSITKYPELPIWGIETKDIYFKNIIDFNRIMKFSPSSQVFISQTKKAITQLKPKVYSKDLLDLDNKESEFSSQKLDTAKYIKYLLDFANTINSRDRSKNISRSPTPKNNTVRADNGNMLSKLSREHLDISRYKNISLLTETMEMEKSIDQLKIMKDSQNLLLNLQSTLQNRSLNNDLDSLMARSNLFKGQKISPFSFYSYLKDLALKHTNPAASAGKFQPTQLDKYPNLNSFIDYLIKVNSLDSTKLFTELEDLNFEIKQSLSKTDEQKTLVKLSHNINFLENFFNLKVSNEDLDYYLNNKESHKVSFFKDFLPKTLKRYNINTFIDYNPDLIDNHLHELEDFYKVVKDRDIAMVTNTLSEIEKRNVKLATLIHGGFHTKGITKFLREKGYSYIIVSPYSKTDIDEENYHFLLSGRRKPIADLIKKYLNLPEIVNRLAPPSTLRVPLAFSQTVIAFAQQIANATGGGRTAEDLAQAMATLLGLTVHADVWHGFGDQDIIGYSPESGVVVVPWGSQYLEITASKVTVVDKERYRGGRVVYIPPAEIMNKLKLAIDIIIKDPNIALLNPIVVWSYDPKGTVRIKITISNPSDAQDTIMFQIWRIGDSLINILKTDSRMPNASHTIASHLDTLQRDIKRLKNDTRLEYWYKQARRIDRVTPSAQALDQPIAVAVRGADQGVITKTEHEAMRDFLKKADARNEKYARHDLEERFGIRGKIRVYSVPDMFNATGFKGHYVIRDGVVYIDKDILEGNNGELYLHHEIFELEQILDFGRKKFGGKGISEQEVRAKLVTWLDEEGHIEEVRAILLKFHNEAPELPYESEEIIADVPVSRKETAANLVAATTDEALIEKILDMGYIAKYGMQGKDIVGDYIRGRIGLEKAIELLVAAENNKVATKDKAKIVLIAAWLGAKHKLFKLGQSGIELYLADHPAENLTIYLQSDRRYLSPEQISGIFKEADILAKSDKAVAVTGTQEFLIQGIALNVWTGELLGRPENMGIPYLDRIDGDLSVVKISKGDMILVFDSCPDWLPERLRALDGNTKKKIKGIIITQEDLDDEVIAELKKLGIPVVYGVNREEYGKIVSAAGVILESNGVIRGIDRPVRGAAVGDREGMHTDAYYETVAAIDNARHYINLARKMLSERDTGAYSYINMASHRIAIAFGNLEQEDLDGTQIGNIEYKGKEIKAIIEELVKEATSLRTQIDEFMASLFRGDIGGGEADTRVQEIEDIKKLLESDDFLKAHISSELIERLVNEPYKQRFVIDGLKVLVSSYLWVMNEYINQPGLPKAKEDIIKEVQVDTYPALIECLDKISQRVASGDLTPNAVTLRLSEKDTVEPAVNIGRRPKVKFLPMKGDPWQWGHFWMIWRALADGYDQVVVMLDNSEPRKPNLTALPIREADSQWLFDAFGDFVKSTNFQRQYRQLFNSDGETVLPTLIHENLAIASDVDWMYSAGYDHCNWSRTEKDRTIGLDVPYKLFFVLQTLFREGINLKLNIRLTRRDADSKDTDEDVVNRVKAINALENISITEFLAEMIDELVDEKIQAEDNIEFWQNVREWLEQWKNDEIEKARKELTPEQIELLDKYYKEGKDALEDKSENRTAVNWVKAFEKATMWQGEHRENALQVWFKQLEAMQQGAIEFDVTQGKGMEAANALDQLIGQIGIEIEVIKQPMDASSTGVRERGELHTLPLPFVLSAKALQRYPAYQYSWDITHDKMIASNVIGDLIDLNMLFEGERDRKVTEYILKGHICAGIDNTEERDKIWDQFADLVDIDNLLEKLNVRLLEGKLDSALLYEDEAFKMAMSTIESALKSSYGNALHAIDSYVIKFFSNNEMFERLTEVLSQRGFVENREKEARKLIDRVRSLISKRADEIIMQARDAEASSRTYNSVTRATASGV